MDIDGADPVLSDDEQKAIIPSEIRGAQPRVGEDVGEWFLERSKFIPLRLTMNERKFLRLLEAALQVSEYTDKIDTLSFGSSKTKRIVSQIRELCTILSGLVFSVDYKQGQELFADRDFESNSDFYQRIFELGRRHKIMNPDKMRTYGKLIYLLQVYFLQYTVCPLLTMPFRIVRYLRSKTFSIFLACVPSKLCTLFWKSMVPQTSFGIKQSQSHRWRSTLKAVLVVIFNGTSKTRNVPSKSFLLATNGRASVRKVSVSVCTA
jgi:hypothetical protein